MQFWTTDEFKKFLGKVSDKPQARAGFLILYYTGLRIGELLALEYGDIDFKNCTINVNKSYQHIRGKDVVTPPKTPKIVRIVSILEFLRDEIRNYTERLYGLHKHDRIFPYTKSFFEHEMIRGTKDGDVKWILPQDIRRSHASQLIHMDFSILAVSERLGHEKVHPPASVRSPLSGSPWQCGPAATGRVRRIPFTGSVAKCQYQPKFVKVVHFWYTFKK